jgi:threonine dehydrogenase-like Zn-dependent dehydrogenase
MRALVYDGQLRLTVCPVPDPGPDEALIQVRLAGICGTDLEIGRGYKGFHGILGHEFVGVVVFGLRPEWLGRRVCGEINVSCGQCHMCRSGLRTHCERRSVLGVLDRPGAFAEFVTLPYANLHAVPDAVEDARAVFVEPLAAAFEVLEQVDVRSEMSAAVIGDGRLGILCAQVLRNAGADVTVLGRHHRKLRLLARLGMKAADVGDAPVGRHDIVVEATGSPSGLTEALSRVRPRGTLILKSTYVESSPINLSPAVVGEVTIVGSRCGPFDRALDALLRNAVEVESMIDAVYPLQRGVEAMARAATPGTLKVLLRMEPSEPC